MLSPGPAATSTPTEPLFVEEDSSVREARAALAFPLIAKFQPDFHKDQAINIVGLKALCMRLALDISEIELERIFAEVDCDTDGWLSLAELCEAMRTSHFFASLALTVTSSRAFRVGRAYDYGCSTYENYTDASAFASGTDGLPDPFVYICPISSVEDQHEVTEARKALGLSDTFSPARERWQHAVVLRAAPKTLPQAATPWLLVTLSHPSGDPRTVLRWMARHGLLPVRQLLPISAALLAHCMPELPLYARQGGSAFVRPEAELLEQLVLEVAVARGQNVWLQCLPCDAGRLCLQLRNLRTRHPGCRLGVLDVRVDAEAARRGHRAAVRETGRGVLEPPTQPDVAELLALADIVDFLARVEHSSCQPVLQSIWQSDVSGSWAALGQRISTPPASLPLLPPLRLQRRPVDFPQTAAGAFSLDLITFGPAMLCAETARRLAQLLGRTELALVHSEPQAVLPQGLTPTKGTKTVARLHGAQLLTARTLTQHGINPESLVVRLALRGGFVHLGVKGPVCVDVATHEPSELLMQFGPPEELPPGLLSRVWHPVTEEAVWSLGMRSECWLEPGAVGGKGGAFAYRFSEEAARALGCVGALYRVLVP